MIRGFIVLAVILNSCTKDEEDDFSGPSGAFVDTRDGTEYEWVRIGDQIWMAENLAYLPSVSPSSEGSYTDPYYYVCDYQGSSVSEAKETNNYSTYGVLYNYPAAMNGASSSTTNPSGVQGVCPTGWHLPSDAEWTQLTDYLGGESVAGGMLKETGTRHWDNPNTGATNETGFTALPGGDRYDDVVFYFVGYYGDWWSATEFGANSATARGMGYDRSDVCRHPGYKEDGYSIRCLKD